MVSDLKVRFNNIFGESLLLSVDQFEDCSQVMVKKAENHETCSHLMVGLIVVLIVCNVDVQAALVTKIVASVLISVAFILTKLYLQVTDEHLVVFDFLDGVQYSTFNIFGQKKSLYIPSKRIIIREVITMQRAVYTLSALMGDEAQLLASNKSAFKLVPLFAHLYPRLDILKAIYNVVHQKDYLRKSTAIKQL